MLELFLSPAAGRRVRFVLPDVALMSGALAARAEVSIEPTTASLRHVDYAFAVEKSKQGVPVIHWETCRAQPRKVITQDREGLVLENQWFRATLIPSMGRVYSFVDKATNHEQLYINRLAIPLGAHNDTGFWMTWGGIEHVMPRGEHSTSHALDWK